MSIKIIQPEIERFLSNPTAGVLVISGEWGVGKTYAWNTFLRQAAAKGIRVPEFYSYVSLFGLGNLDDLRSAIFQNTISKSDIGKDADIDTLDSVIKSSPTLWRKSGTLARLLPGAEKYASTFEKIGFFWIKNHLICIDDLERLSEKLSIRDVLGLASHLKEQRKCKVIILANDRKIEGQNDADFKSQIEKVADLTFKFDPTPSESVEIALDESYSFYNDLKENCLSLKIVNIRTIKKIETIAKRLEEELSKYDRQVLEQAIHALTLGGFSKLQPDDAPNMEFLKSYNYYIGNLNPEEPQDHPDWRETLEQYGFRGMDEFCGVIFRIVERGHVDSDELSREAKRLHDQFQAHAEDKSFQQAWDLYHDSFDDNVEELTSALAAAVTNTPKSISPMNLSSTIEILKELGWEGNTSELIDGYVYGRQAEPKDFWDFNEYHFGDRVNDPDVRAAFSAKLATFEDDRDLKDLLISIGKSRSWNVRDIAFLAAQPPDAFLEVFKSEQGNDLRAALAGALGFREIANADDDMQTITANAEEALRVIGQESPINRRRVLQRGVALE